MSIERQFDVPLVAEMALREKQIQQVYRPIIAVHKWFARRPGTLFRGLLLSEFVDGPLRESFYRSHDLPGLRVADPFMGGGIPLVEANRIGCDIEGLDINPMSVWIVREEITSIDLTAYQQAANALRSALDARVGHYYRTECPLYGDSEVPVKSFLWVKTLKCQDCAHSIDLFPGFVLARDSRHPTNVLICPECGDLNDAADLARPGDCTSCSAELRVAGPAGRGRCDCPKCGQSNTYPDTPARPPAHRLFAIEYHNPRCRPHHKGRFFKKPDAEDLERVRAAAGDWRGLTPRFVPDAEIPAGDESNRLRRWGYNRYREMSNSRQLLGLELSCRLIANVPDSRIRQALATNLSDLLRYQNMLCRYDSKSLKALDVFSVHGFPVGLVQCEPNLLGIPRSNGGNVGSGGWSNITSKYLEAKRFCEAPFEVKQVGSRRHRVPIQSERIGAEANGRRRAVRLRRADATSTDFEPDTLDAVLTDPPYFGNVQYAELMDYCFAWLQRLAATDDEGFNRTSTRSSRELTGNATEARGLSHFAEGLSAAWTRAADALKPGAPLAFTFHHNRVKAYSAVGVAILDPGFVCTAALPCPAEMSGSIHIHGTTSSIVDTVFVCRPAGAAFSHELPNSEEDLSTQIAQERSELRAAGWKATYGDIRCMLLGHLTRLAVNELHSQWNRSLPTERRLGLVEEVLRRFGNPDDLARRLAKAPLPEQPATRSPSEAAPEVEQVAIPF